jgi:hypothetical protein
MSSKDPVPPIRISSMIISSGLVLLLLAGCSLPSPAISTPIPAIPTALPLVNSPTGLPATATSMPAADTPTTIPASPTPQATATDTPQPTATATVTATPMPTASATPGPMSIVFATGTTAAVVQGSVQPGQVVQYSLAAGQYQPMILRLDSLKGDVILGVLEPNGNKLLDPANKWTYWQWLLPKKETYTIQVIGAATAETYTLTVKVAQLVYFASGATSITLNGSTVKGYVFTYALNCKSGQTMTASLNVPATSATIDIFGLATGSLLAPSAKAITWTGVLLSSQDYLIEVIPVNGAVVNYSLTVSVH